jgi:lipopolysaccharide export system permease protein
MTLSLYFARRFVVNFIRVLLAIGLMIVLIDFLSNLNRLNGIENAIQEALVLSLFRTATYLSIAMPLIIMLAGLAFSVGLARSSEFVISRASGQSALRSLVSVIICAFGLGLVSVFFFDPWAGRLVSSYDQRLENLRGEKETAIVVNESGYWMRQSTSTGHQIIKAKSASDNGRVLRDLSVFTYDKSGQVQSRTFAQTAFLYSKEWVLTQGKTWTDSALLSDPASGSQDFKILRIPTDVTPLQLLAGYPSPETISPWDMPAQIERIESSGFSTIKYRSQQFGQFARPFLFAAMVIIGCVFTLQSARLGNLGISVVSSVLFGFALHFLQNFATTLGRSGEIPLLLSVWAPILSAGLVAVALFLHYEDG